MADRSIFRLRDMHDSISHIMSLLSAKSMDDLFHDPFLRAAFERFLEVMSEVSRHIPGHWKADYPDIEWRKIADLGNHLRHAYHKTDYEILWRVYENELPGLHEATGELLRKWEA